MSQLQKFTNNASATLNASISSGSTTITLSPGQGILFPVLTGSLFFIGTLKSVTTGLLEIVKVTARTSDTLTVTRAQEGTTASAFVTGDVFELRPTTQAFDNLYAASAQLDGASFTGTVTATTQASTDNSTKVATTAYVTTAVSNAPTSFKNILINGNFSVNQLVVSGTVTLAAGIYGHDGWKAGTSGCTYTFALSGIDTIITITAGTLVQIADSKKVRGGVYTVSNAGTAQGRIAINGSGTSGSFAALPLTTASATAGQIITVEFTTGTLNRVQLELGSIPTSFAVLTPEIALIQCQAYFEKSYDIGTAPGTVTQVGCEVSAICSAFFLASGRTIYKVTKNSSPTVIIYSPQSGSSGQFYGYDAADGNINPYAAAPVAGNSGQSGFMVFASAGNMTPDVSTRIRWHWSSSARL